MKSSAFLPSSALSRRGNPGFTLIELLTVIAIIGILAGILIPVVGKVRATAQAGVCASNLRQIGQQMMLYINDNRGRLPAYNSTTVTGSFLTDARVLPVAQKKPQLARDLWPYYTRKALPTSIRNLGIHENFICPVVDSKWSPTPIRQNTNISTAVFSYILNDVQSFKLGGKSVRLFGYTSDSITGFKLENIESAALKGGYGSLSQVWIVQDADRAMDGRSSQTVFPAERAAHDSFRQRVNLDGSVSKINLVDSGKNYENYTPPSP